MQVVSLLLGTLVLSSLVLTVSADTEIYSENLDLYNKKEILFTGEKTEDSPLEARNFRDESNSLTAHQKQVEGGRSSFHGRELADNCTSETSFNIPLLNQLLTSNGLGPLTGITTLTTNILNMLLLAHGDLEIATLNQILQGLGITPIPVPGNTLDTATLDKIIEQVKCGKEKPVTVKPKTGNHPWKPKECESLNMCLEFIGLPKVTFDGKLDRHLLIGILNQNGHIDSDTLGTFLICLRIKPNDPDRLSVIDSTILSQILDALRITIIKCEDGEDDDDDDDGEDGEVGEDVEVVEEETSSSTLTIAAAAMAALQTLLAALVPAVIGFLVAFLLLDKQRYDEHYGYYETITPTLYSSYSPSSSYESPPTLDVPKTYGTPHLQ